MEKIVALVYLSLTLFMFESYGVLPMSLKSVYFLHLSFKILFYFQHRVLLPSLFDLLFMLDVIVLQIEDFH